ncbi:MAG: ribosome maturation factor RimM [Actinomycetota bacterium]
MTSRLEVGRIGKAHGLKGEVVVDFSTDRTAERTARGAELWSDDRRLVVASARPHQQKWLIRFDGVADRDAAETLRGLVLAAEPLEDPEAVFVHELVGRTLIDQHGTDHGPVVAMIDNPASDLLELDDGRLVPLAFYVSHDDHTVTVDVPVGLLDDGAIGDGTDDAPGAGG